MSENLFAGLDEAPGERMRRESGVRRRKWVAFWTCTLWTLGVCLGIGIGATIGYVDAGGPTRLAGQTFAMSAGLSLLGALFGLVMGVRAVLDDESPAAGRRGGGLREGDFILAAAIGGALFCGLMSIHQWGHPEFKSSTLLGAAIGGGGIVLALMTCRIVYSLRSKNNNA